ncbi:exonuclease II Exo2, partial [Coemansia spiralis]
MLPGFPSLFTAPHTAALAFNGTEVFGSPSRDETMMVNLLSSAFDEAGSTAAVAQELLHGKSARGAYHPRRVFVSWPYLADAALVGVSDEAGVYTIGAAGTALLYFAHASDGERQIWKRMFVGAAQAAKRERGMVLAERRPVLLHVLPLRGMQMYPDGSLVRDYGFPAAAAAHEAQPWAPVASWADAGVQSFPAGLALADLAGPWANNLRFAEHEAVPLESAYEIGSRVFFIGRTPLYGSPGKVIGHARSGSGAVVGVDLQLKAFAHPAAARRENFLGVDALKAFSQTGRGLYIPSYAVARDVGLSTLLLSRITSRMVIVGVSGAGSDDSSRIHIGLNLKFEAKRQKVAGYTRRAPSGWQYSDRAVALIASYKAAFPDMFANLERAVKSDAQVTAAECFAPRAQGAAAAGPSNNAHVTEEIKRVKQWFKANVDRSTMPQVSTDSEALSKEQIDAI